MTTITKLGEPARLDNYGLTVDNYASPSTFIALRYPDKGSRHREPFERLPEVPCGPPDEATAHALVMATGMPASTARILLHRVTMKLASPYGGDADGSNRPVR